PAAAPEPAVNHGGAATPVPASAKPPKRTPNARPKTSAKPPPAKKPGIGPVPVKNGGGKSPMPQPQAPKVQVPPNIGQNPEKLHAWLCQRIEAIQEERQSGWKRILDMVLGKPAEEGQS